MYQPASQHAEELQRAAPTAKFDIALTEEEAKTE